MFTSSKSFDIVDRKMSVEALTEENSLLKSEIERLYGIIKLMKPLDFGFQEADFFCENFDRHLHVEDIKGLARSELP